MDTVRCVNLPFRMESENWYLQVVTTSIDQLSLGPGGNNLEKSSTALSRGNTSQNPQMAAVLSGPTQAIGYGGATMKQLED